MTSIVPIHFYPDDGARFNIDRARYGADEYTGGIRDPHRFHTRNEQQFHEVDHWFHDNRRGRYTLPSAENHYITQVTDPTNAGVAYQMAYDVAYGAQHSYDGLPGRYELEFRDDYSEHHYQNEVARVWERAMSTANDPTAHPQDFRGTLDGPQNTNMVMRRDLGRRDAFTQADFNLTFSPMESFAEPNAANPEAQSRVKHWFPDRQMISDYDTKTYEPDGLFSGYVRF
jgi:hypothetical protein